MKWANDKDSNFDTLYNRLLELVARTTKTPPYRQQPYDYQLPFP
jgi:two-component SAPR family response regulator